MEAWFAPGYSVTTPAHPVRSFAGRQTVRRTWEGILAAHPTMQAGAEPQVHSCDEIWAEWEYTSETGEHGQFWFRGVAVTVNSEGVIESARFYPVDTEGGSGRQ
ncbi:nuclear transport factor 2 family protein [Promicromonospora sp. CA-289599]|uniref:nuclear transport factor 2 family protein n=1 Tax=Promicromonospora sp. CA-289599 TaxID=3240014 RepID=UPI003D8C9563